jgi:hypothetical protein
MKRIALVLLAGLAYTGFLAAQTAQGSWSAETLRGNLALIDGQIAIQTQDTVYYIPRLGRLAGFIDGLKEGAAVVLEGQSYRLGTAADTGSTIKIFQPEKLILGGRTWDGLNAGARGSRTWDSPDSGARSGRILNHMNPAMPDLPAPGMPRGQGRSR